MTGVFLPHWQFNDWTVVGWDGVAILHLHQPVSTNINTDNFSFIFPCLCMVCIGGTMNANLK